MRAFIINISSFFRSISGFYESRDHIKNPFSSFRFLQPWSTFAFRKAITQENPSLPQAKFLFFLLEPESKTCSCTKNVTISNRTMLLETCTNEFQVQLLEILFLISKYKLPISYHLIIMQHSKKSLKSNKTPEYSKLNTIRYSLSSIGRNKNHKYRHSKPKFTQKTHQSIRWRRVTGRRRRYSRRRSWRSGWWYRRGCCLRSWSQ